MHYSCSIFVGLPIVSIFVRKTCTVNIIYRGSVYCVPKRNDRPLAKDLSESRLFTLETVTEWKYAGHSKFITVALLRKRKILHHQHWDYKQTCPLQHLWFLLFALHLNTNTKEGCTVLQPVDSLQHVSVTHPWLIRFRQRNLVTFNHGSSLLAGGPSALHYRSILLQRVCSTAAGATHITWRTLINQTRASFQQWPSAVQDTISERPWNFWTRSTVISFFMCQLQRSRAIVR